MLSERQLREIHAEFMAIPFVADVFSEEIGMDIADIPKDQFRQYLKLAKKFRELACEFASVKSSRLQSKSRERGSIRMRKW